MGGVDRADQLASTYCFLRKALKWWWKLFLMGLEIRVINSYILYKSAKKHGNFVKTLVNQLRDFCRTRHRASTSTCSYDEVRSNGKLHVMLTGVRKDYKVCSWRNKPGERHQTIHYCDTCLDKLRMHLGDCFIKYHTKQRCRI